MNHLHFPNHPLFYPAFFLLRESVFIAVKLPRMRSILYRMPRSIVAEVNNWRMRNSGDRLVSRRSMTRFMKVRSFIEDTGQADVI